MRKRGTRVAKTEMEVRVSLKIVEYPMISWLITVDDHFSYESYTLGVYRVYPKTNDLVHCGLDAYATWPQNHAALWCLDFPCTTFMNKENLYSVRMLYASCVRRVRIYIYIYIIMCINIMYVYNCKYMIMYMYVYICMVTHTHTHRHTHTYPEPPRMH